MYSHSAFNLLRRKFTVLRYNAVKNSSTATIELKSEYQLHNLEKGPSTTVELTKEDGIKMFRDMDLVRRFENSCAQLYREKIIRGFCHLYAGEEAVAVGVTAAMRPEDVCITAYRCHGFAYLLGATIEQVISELTGRKSGIAAGKGGSMHMYTPKLYGGNGIVGSHIPVGTGLAFALKYAGKKGLCLTLYGDGAANQGQCFESFNLAKVLDVPIIYICENNYFGLGTHYERVAANPKFYTRCEYIPGIFVDGMDALAVRHGIRFAIDFVSAGKGPLILECLTYRYYGHSMSDPGTSYRKREEIEETREKRDCLKKIKEYLTSSKLCTPEEISAIEKEDKKLVDKATAFAKTDKFPPIEEINTDVYYNALESVRNVLHYKPLPHILSKRFPLNTINP